MSMGSLTEDHNVTNARKDLKPITKFHSIGITPGEDFFFNISGEKKGKKSVDKKLEIYQYFKI